MPIRQKSQEKGMVMPLVKALLRPGADIAEHDLFLACRHVVPAGYNSPKGRLTPGSIEFDARRVGHGNYLTVDVLLEAEAFPYKDRDNLDKRTKMIKAALKELFPGVTFAVWPKLVRAGWASDSSDPEFDGDLSMPAAIERARAAMDDH